MREINYRPLMPKSNLQASVRRRGAGAEAARAAGALGAGDQGTWSRRGCAGSCANLHARAPALHHSPAQRLSARASPQRLAASTRQPRWEHARAPCAPRRAGVSGSSRAGGRPSPDSKLGAGAAQVADVAESLGLDFVQEEPACGGLHRIDISIRMPDGRKVAMEVRGRIAPPPAAGHD